MRPDPTVISKAAANVLTWDVNVVAKMLAVKFPQTWSRMKVRSIDAPGNYFSSQILRTGLTSAIEESRVQTKLESNMGIVAGILEKHDFPLYYVSASLLEALKHSHPPTNMTWENITLHFTGLCFMIPRGSIIEPEPTKKEIACIGIVKLQAGERFQIPTAGHVTNKNLDRYCVFWILGPGGLEANDMTFVTTQTLEPEIHWLDEANGNRPYNGPPNSFASAMAGLIANFVLVMEARKELIEPGVRKPAGKRQSNEVYTPTFIGRNYSILRERPTTERQGQFTELGWRAGHFKRQHHGPKREQVKTIFVDPYIAFVRGLKPLESPNIAPTAGASATQEQSLKEDPGQPGITKL